MEDKLICPDCDGDMEPIADYDYTNQQGIRVVGLIHHCENCGHDEVVEEKWKLIDREQRRYFHG